VEIGISTVVFVVVVAVVKPFVGLSEYSTLYCVACEEASQLIRAVDPLSTI